MAGRMNDTIMGGPSDHDIKNLQEMAGLIKSLRGDSAVAHSSALTEIETYNKFKEQLEQDSSLRSIENQLKNEKLSTRQRADLQRKAAKERQAIEERALRATETYADNRYKNASVKEKAQIKRKNAEAIAADRKAEMEKFDNRIALAAADEKEVKRLQDEKQKYVKESIDQESKLKEDARKLEAAAEDKSRKSLTFKGKADQFVENKEKNIEKLKGEIGEIDDQIGDLLKSGIDPDDPKVQELMAKKAEKEGELAGEHFGKVAGKELQKLASSFDGAFKEAESLMTQYAAHIDARVQGSDRNYSKIADVITSNLSFSPYLKVSKVLDKMQEGVDQGILYNIEQRSFLGTIADKIANTFDAFDANLTRLIRIQQADSTAARLGMEASLTKLFNNMFQDTSYLSDLYDSISAAIIDANASMTRDASAEFEYIVQKWLGALSSLGMSGDVLTQIATGINYIATGDVTSLSSNSQLQTLMAMAASEAGLSISDLFIEGLDASSTNELMKSMVVYLKKIAESSDNQVVRAAYGDIFNMSMSDMKAITNLTSGDISSIYKNTMSYSSMMNELNYQFDQLSKRVTLAEKMSNLYNNAVYGVASDLVNNPITYSMYKMLEFMDENKIDINIPSFSAAGFGLDLEATVGDLMSLALGIGGAMSLAGNILAGLGSDGGTNLGSAWNATDYTKRGNGLAFTTGGVRGDVSGSTYITTSNSQDMRDSTISSATDDAESTKEITSKNTEKGYTIDDFYKAVVEGNEPYIKVKDDYLSRVFDNETHYISAKASVSGFSSAAVEDIRKAVESAINQIKTPTVKVEGTVDIDTNAITKAFQVATGSSDTSTLLTVLEDVKRALTDHPLHVHIAECDSSVYTGISNIID